MIIFRKTYVESKVSDLHDTEGDEKKRVARTFVALPARVTVHGDRSGEPAILFCHKNLREHQD